MAQNGADVFGIKDKLDFNLITGKMWRRLETGTYLPLVLPVSYVVMAYTMREPCFTVAECTTELKWMQKCQMYRVKQVDIRFNFVIGGEGSVYEVRGWGNQPNLMSKLSSLNSKSLYIGFMGTFKDEPPGPHMLEAQNHLLKYGVKKKYITPKFNLWTARGKEKKDNRLNFLQMKNL